MKIPKPKRLAAKIIFKTENLHDFETKMYSRMKYGDPVATKRIALHLASAITNHPFVQKLIISEEPILITSSAFGVIPTASYSVAREVTKLLQSLDVKHDRIKFERGGDFATNHYGTMTADERSAAMKKRQIFLSKTDKEKIKNKHVLIIDDISVTGSHEKKLHQLLSESGAKDWIFAYYYLLGKKIAAQSPETEEDLNRSEIRTVLDLIPFFKDYSKNTGYKLRLNSRVLKFILTTTPESIYDVDAYTKEAHLKYFFKKTLRVRAYFII